MLAGRAAAIDVPFFKT